MIVETVIIKQIPIQSSTPRFRAELSSGTTYSYVHWYRLRLKKGVSF